MTSLRLPAYGKINLSLDVLALRDDGYHEIASVMQTIKLADTLTFTLNNTGEIRLTSSENTLTTGDDNLIVKAARLLQEKFEPRQGVDIFLEKEIPIAAGLGGGSSNGAATLKGLNYLWRLNLPLGTLIALGSKLGADVPFCLVGGTVLAEGIGEKLSILPPAPSIWAVLVKPEYQLRAGEVYKFWDQANLTSGQHTPELLLALKKRKEEAFIQSFGNDLEKPVRTLLPEIKKIQEELTDAGAIKSLVSGSGPTVLGFVTEERKAIEIGNRFKRRYEAVFVTCTV